MSTRRWLAASAAVAALVCAVALSACGGSSNSGNGSTSSGGGKSVPKIAFLSPSTANTYLAATWAGMQKVAKQRGAELTQFDAGFDPAKQQQELEAAVAAHRYDGVIISPVTAALASDVQAAAAAGLKVVEVGNILGTRLDTAQPQVRGVSLGVHEPPVYLGGELGDLTLRACANKNPCRVVYFYGLKGTPTDNGFFNGFQQRIAQNPAVRIVATGEGRFLGPDVALAAMQNILQSTPNFDVVVGADQSMQGVQLALQQAGKLDRVAIVGLGGSRPGVKAVAAGKWYGGAMMVPETEGEVALTGMLDLLKNGHVVGPTGINPLTSIPLSRRLITRQNASSLTPQWNG